MGKPKNRKKSNKEQKLLKSYKLVMNDYPPAIKGKHQWNDAGDTFVKFTTYQSSRSIALPHSG
jgi:hypothetical protein